MNEAIQESTHSENNGAAGNLFSGIHFHTGNFITFDQQSLYHALQYKERLMFLEFRLCYRSINDLIRLGTGSPDCCAFASIEHAKMDSRSIDEPPHESAKSVDFPYDISFGNAPYCRVAGHLPNQIDIVCYQKDLEIFFRRYIGRFDPCVSSADNNKIKVHGFHLKNLRN
jgi:hypothetical protein